MDKYGRRKQRIIDGNNAGGSKGISVVEIDEDWIGTDVETLEIDGDVGNEFGDAVVDKGVGAVDSDVEIDSVGISVLVKVTV